ncbi:MAG: hypothetical protein BHW57_00680 [Azospirillum sp. 47_25]|nr:MAG: hypothetical protein BHW57_00680 [Azospirillum sp. 47_25]
MFESITISFEGDDNMSVNIMRILSLYEKTGIHIKNLNNIETGKTTLANHDIGKLLNYYGIDVRLTINSPDN